MPDLKDRFIGVMLGTAIGDALGAPVEGLGQDEIKRKIGVVDRIIDQQAIGVHPNFWRMPGLYTDDTQLSLIVADTIIRMGTFSPDSFCQTCVDMARSLDHYALGVLRGTGMNFQTTVESWGEHIPWNASGSDTSGNGAAMRVAPIGIFFRDHPQQLIRSAIESAICTHRNPTGILAAVSQAQLVALMSGIDPDNGYSAIDLAKMLVAATRRALPVLSEEYGPYLICPSSEDDPWIMGLEGLEKLLTMEESNALSHIASQAASTSAFPIDGPSHPYAPASVLLSIFMSIKHATEPADALAKVVSIGGDSDTTGAMVGAALGALHGERTFPESWKQATKNIDNIRLFAEQLYSVLQGSAPEVQLPNLHEMEHRLTVEEYQQWLGRFGEK